MEIWGDIAKRYRGARLVLIFAAAFVLSFSLFATGGIVYQHFFTKNTEPLAGLESASIIQDPTLVEERFEASFASVASADVEAIVPDDASGIEGGAGGEGTFSSGPSFPTRIRVPSVGIDFAIVNPLQSDIASLDDALIEGVVRYPGSGTLFSESPMFFFGHSSHLPVVHNKAFQAFNNLEKVKPGDMIVVLGDTLEYHYEARSVTLLLADEAKVMLGGSGKTLTLATCNNFGEKQERFVVEADFVGAYPVSSL